MNVTQRGSVGRAKDVETVVESSRSQTGRTLAEGGNGQSRQKVTCESRGCMASNAHLRLRVAGASVSTIDHRLSRPRLEACHSSGGHVAAKSGRARLKREVGCLSMRSSRRGDTLSRCDRQCSRRLGRDGQGPSARAAEGGGSGRSGADWKRKVAAVEGFRRGQTTRPIVDMFWKMRRRCGSIEASTANVDDGGVDDNAEMLLRLTEGPFLRHQQHVDPASPSPTRAVKT